MDPGVLVMQFISIYIYVHMYIYVSRFGYRYHEYMYLRVYVYKRCCEYRIGILIRMCIYVCSYRGRDILRADDNCVCDPMHFIREPLIEPWECKWRWSDKSVASTL